MATGRVPTTANSPLTAKGDLFGYSTTQARVPVGNNGETLVADSSASTGLRWQGNFAAGKNKIINGDFNIWQRGDTFNSIASQAYSADRFITIFNGSGSTRNVTRQAFTAGTAPVAGYENQYFLRYDQTVAGTSGTFSNIGQRIEDVRTFAGQTVTVSFWAKAAATTTIGVGVLQNFGSGGSGNVTNEQSTAFSVTTSWARYSYTFSVASISGKTIGAGNYLNIYAMLPLNATFTFDTWGWQVEAGSVATAFQTATGTLAGELAACQRYYYRNSSTASQNYAYFGMGVTNTTTNGKILLKPPTTMRVMPTSVDFANLAVQENMQGTLYAVSAISIATDGSVADSILINSTIATATGSKPCVILANASSSAYLGFSAEL